MGLADSFFRMERKTILSVYRCTHQREPSAPFELVLQQTLVSPLPSDGSKTTKLILLWLLLFLFDSIRACCRPTKAYSLRPWKGHFMYNETVLSGAKKKR